MRLCFAADSILSTRATQGLLSEELFAVLHKWASAGLIEQ